jgi:NADPH:quinone reductase-like Zn-dependent oxidoreductase
MTRDALAALSAKETFDAIFINDGTQIKLHLRRLSSRGVAVVYGFHSVVAAGPRKLLHLLKYFFTTSVSVGDLVYNNHSVAGFNLVHFMNDTELIKKRMRQLSDILTKGEYGSVTLHECTLPEVEQALKALLRGEDVGKWIIRMYD